MDPALILDTLTPDDMEIWQCGGYNFFNEDNLNASFRDSIKEENIEMEYCLSSICPNDLLSNMDATTRTYLSNVNNSNTFPANAYSSYDFAINNNALESFSYSSSSSSSSYSSPSSNMDENQGHFAKSLGLIGGDYLGNKMEFKLEDSSSSSPSSTETQFVHCDHADSLSHSPFSSLNELQQQQQQQHQPIGIILYEIFFPKIKPTIQNVEY